MECPYKNYTCGYPSKCDCIKFEAYKKATETKESIIEYNINLPKLESMFRMQKKFGSRFYDFEQMTDAERLSAMEKNVTYASAELHEILEELPYKHWKKPDDLTPEKIRAIQNEIGDVIHIAIQMALIMGMDADSIYRDFIGKTLENTIRQELGY